MIKINFSNVALTGTLIWLWLAYTVQPDLDQHEWARLVLVLAVLVWVPIVFSLLGYPVRSALPVALGGYTFLAAMYLPISAYAGILAGGWLLVCLWVFKNGVDKWLKRRDAGDWAVAAGQMFLVVGGLSAVADRWGVYPFGFDPAIILLTAVHFHFAGFIFPILTGWLHRVYPTPISRWAAILAVVSVPVTAIGITLSQISGNYIVEAVAAVTVAISGWLSGWGYIRKLADTQIRLATRLFWAIGGLSLFFTMTLAVGYAIRPWWPIEWLQIPFMRAWHGTINAFGVGGMILLGWWIKNGVTELHE